MSRSGKRAQGGFVRLPSPLRTFAGHEPKRNRAADHNKELTYMRTLALYAMR